MRKRNVIIRYSVIMAALLLLNGCGSSGNNREQDEITVVSREEGSGTRGAFVELFSLVEKINGIDIDMTTEEAIITNNTSVMLSSVAGNEYAIGYLSLGSLNDSVKLVTIEGTEPTAANIKNGTYKISRPFQIVTRGELSKVSEDFYQYIQSSDGQKIVAESGYIPAGQESAYQEGKPSGKVVVAGSSSVAPVMEKLKEGYLKVNPNAEVEIQQSDSTTGITSVKEGICDIGMASRELKSSEQESGLNSQVIALDGIVIVINHANQIDDLSIEQVREIFNGSVIAWKEVGE